MSSRPASARPASPNAPHLLLVVLAAAVALTACGKQGDPLPPLRVVPITTNDLAVRQQGSVILLGMSYPAVTTSGAALGGVDAVELLQLVSPAPEGVAPELDVAAFTSGASALLTLKGTDLGATVTGDQIQIQLPLDLPLAEANQALTFAVLTKKANETSALSNRVTIVPRNPVEAPGRLEVEPGPNGVTLSWSFDGDDPEAFEIYRRQARNRGYGEALAQVPGDKRSFVDRGARFEERYIYTVRTVASRNPPISSGEAGEREVDYQDRFPPPLPANFVALGEAGSARLRWDASPAADVRGYVLYRKDPGRDFHAIVDAPITGTELVDRGLAAGLVFEYRIQVIDQVGNESELSAPVRVTIR